MPQPSRASQQSAETNARFIVDLIDGVGRSVALTVEIFLHRDFGAGYVGCGVIGIAVMLGFAIHFADQDLRPLMGFMAVYGLRWLFLAILAAIRYWRGKDMQHSHYNGEPYLWRFLPDWKETSFKHLEALVMILLSYGVRCLNVPLGDYLMIASSMALLRVYNLVARQRHRAIAMNDRTIETQIVADRFRDMQE
jgi:hypothetical protein